MTLNIGLLLHMNEFSTLSILQIFLASLEDVPHALPLPPLTRPLLDQRCRRCRCLDRQPRGRTASSSSRRTDSAAVDITPYSYLWDREEEGERAACDDVEYPLL